MLWCEQWPAWPVPAAFLSSTTWRTLVLPCPLELARPTLSCLGLSCAIEMSCTILSSRVEPTLPLFPCLFLFKLCLELTPIFYFGDFSDQTGEDKEQWRRCFRMLPSCISSSSCDIFALLQLASLHLCQSKWWGICKYCKGAENAGLARTEGTPNLQKLPVFSAHFFPAKNCTKYWSFS